MPWRPQPLISLPSFPSSPTSSRGEILQMKDVHCATQPTGCTNAWTIYLKTASLMAKGCRVSDVLAQGKVWNELAYAFECNFGLAFQVRARVMLALFPFWFISLFCHIRFVLCISLSFILTLLV
ncbi:hypothetical protein B0H19DRAFT_1265339 [Mycena capillaripes]|nr:hypothetical protein B0H19DRAFT_1265339 [Mycena capillaripes]